MATTTQGHVTLQTSEIKPSFSKTLATWISGQRACREKLANGFL
jgi:hypothetical protein